MQGLKGEIGPSNAWSTYITTFPPVTSVATKIASLTLEPGSYIVLAKATLSSPLMEGGNCGLQVGVVGQGPLIDRAAASDVQNATLSLLAPLTTNGGTVSLECQSQDTDATAAYAHLMAIKLGSVTGS